MYPVKWGPTIPKKGKYGYVSTLIVDISRNIKDTEIVGYIKFELCRILWWIKKFKCINSSTQRLGNMKYR